MEPSANSWVLNECHRGNLRPVRAGDLGLNDERAQTRGTTKTNGNRGHPQQENAKPAKLGREVQARLGQQLRAMYDDVVNQGVPDRFADLLNRLEGSGNKDKH